MDRRLSPGKVRRLQAASSPAGVFRILAVDHRGVLLKMMDPDGVGRVPADRVTRLKLDVVGRLAPLATAVILDPQYGALQRIGRSRVEGWPSVMPATSVKGAIMGADHETDDAMYTVVVNHEDQYSIWPSHRDVPPGWTSTGRSGTRGECLESIEATWRDMRPLGLRGRMEAARGEGPAGPGDRDDSPGSDRGPSLVERLAAGRHPVEAALRTGDMAATLKECLGRDYVRIRFPRTRGGTELGMRLDRRASRMLSADFGAGTGIVHLEGELTLDRTRVRCVVDLDLATMRGEGRLVPVVDR